MPNVTGDAWHAVPRKHLTGDAWRAVPHNLLTGDAWRAAHPTETRRNGIGRPGINLTHGHSTGGRMTTEYRAWTSMKQRCLNPRSTFYRHYGGRGISIAPEWVDDFATFLEQVGLKPGRGYSLDRIDNAGNYEPGNVRWATWSQQLSNQRRGPRGPYRKREVKA